MALGSGPVEGQTSFTPAGGQTASDDPKGSEPTEGQSASDDGQQASDGETGLTLDEVLEKFKPEQIVSDQRFQSVIDKRIARGIETGLARERVTARETGVQESVKRLRAEGKAAEAGQVLLDENDRVSAGADVQKQLQELNQQSVDQLYGAFGRKLDDGGADFLEAARGITTQGDDGWDQLLGMFLDRATAPLKAEIAELRGTAAQERGTGPVASEGGATSKGSPLTLEEVNAMSEKQLHTLVTETPAIWAEFIKSQRTAA